MCHVIKRDANASTVAASFSFFAGGQKNSKTSGKFSIFHDAQISWI